MKFKQKPENVREDNKWLSDAFSKILQIEEDKIALIEAAKSYYYMNGNMSYKKFFKYLHKTCVEYKMKLCYFILEMQGELPERTIHSIKLYEISEGNKAFELLAAIEDDFEKEVVNTIDQALANKNWRAFDHFIEILEDIDHICCRALAAVESGNNPVDLIPCEQHSLEK